MLKILWYDVTNLEPAIVMSGLPMDKDIEVRINMEMSDNDLKRMGKLGNAKGGSGHDCALKGITITAMIKAPLYWWKQFDRYTFADTISSSSTMHMILEQDLNQVLLKNTYNSTIDNLRADIKLYKDTNDMEVYERIISNLPQGYLYTRGVTLNYLQAKTMYYQRKNHKLKEWHTFCEWFEGLPHSELFIKE